LIFQNKRSPVSIEMDMLVMIKKIKSLRFVIISHDAYWPIAAQRTYSARLLYQALFFRKITTNFNNH